MVEQHQISPLRILLVEDNRHDREVFLRAFDESLSPVEVTECVRAEEALLVLREHPAAFDLIVTDFQLPGMSGLELFKEVNAENRSFAFVLLTGAGTERLAVEALHTGVDDYLIKDSHQGYVELLPIVLREVVGWRSDRVARRRAEEELRIAHSELERRVQERTVELMRMNDTLRAEIRARSQAEEALQTLSRRLLETQESERRSLARELHDEIGQALTALKINLQEMAGVPDTLLPRLHDSLEILANTLQQVRNLSLDLRPSVLDDLGLIVALEWYVNRQAQRVGFLPHFVADHIEPRPKTIVETTCFRIVQEALTNVARHAKAKNVWVSVECHNGHVALSIRDDGGGFDVGNALARATHGASLGIIGMEERARLVGGEIAIVSQAGLGTEIRATIPLDSATVAVEPSVAARMQNSDTKRKQRPKTAKTRGRA